MLSAKLTKSVGAVKLTLEFTKKCNTFEIFSIQNSSHFHFASEITFRNEQDAVAPRTLEFKLCEQDC